MYTVCPSHLVLRTPGGPNCLTALFLGKADIMTQQCKRRILNDNFEPIWIRSPDFKYWIYSFSTPTQVAVQCRQAEKPSKFEPSYQVTLIGTGILPSSSSCYVHPEIFKLLPHSFGRTKLEQNSYQVTKRGQYFLFIFLFITYCRNWAGTRWQKYIIHLYISNSRNTI